MDNSTESITTVDETAVSEDTSTVASITFTTDSVDDGDTTIFSNLLTSLSTEENDVTGSTTLAAASRNDSNAGRFGPMEYGIFGIVGFVFIVVVFIIVCVCCRLIKVTRRKKRDLHEDTAHASVYEGDNEHIYDTKIESFDGPKETDGQSNSNARNTGPRYVAEPTATVAPPSDGTTTTLFREEPASPYNDVYHINPYPANRADMADTAVRTNPGVRMDTGVRTNPGARTGMLMEAPTRAGLASGTYASCIPTDYRGSAQTLHAQAGLAGVGQANRACITEEAPPSPRHQTDTHAGAVPCYQCGGSQTAQASSQLTRGHRYHPSQLIAQTQTVAPSTRVVQQSQQQHSQPHQPMFDPGQVTPARLRPVHTDINAQSTAPSQGNSPGRRPTSNHSASAPSTSNHSSVSQATSSRNTSVKSTPVNTACMPPPVARKPPRVPRHQPQMVDLQPAFLALYRQKRNSGGTSGNNSMPGNPPSVNTGPQLPPSAPINMADLRRNLKPKSTPPQSPTDKQTTSTAVLDELALNPLFNKVRHVIDTGCKTIRVYKTSGGFAVQGFDADEGEIYNDATTSRTHVPSESTHVLDINYDGDDDTSENIYDFIRSSVIESGHFQLDDSHDSDDLHSGHMSGVQGHDSSGQGQIAASTEDAAAAPLDLYEEAADVAAHYHGS